MAKKKISIPFFLLVCVLLVIITFQITFLSVTQMYRNEIAKMNSANKKETWESKLEYVNELTQKYFLKEISLESLEDILPAAYIAALGDKYTYYMTKEEYEAFTSNNNAEMQGIGVSIVYNSEYGAIEVISVMSDSPALSSGVKAGDLIYIVEGQKVAEIGYYEALNVMLGDAGSVANFSVMREENGSFISIDFSIERGFIVEETVNYWLHGSNVGVIRIDSFDKGTPKQFKTAVDELLKQGADRFVFDVRYNPGGDLTSIVEILDMLLPKGPIIRIIDRYGQETAINSDENEFKYPMTVITNGSTASAAELFTSALRDYNKAIIVGEKTYGKGTMQSVLGLPDGSAVCMTTQTYCPPKSDSYDGIGIYPDIDVLLDEEFSNISLYKLTFEQDKQLKIAVEELCK
ncbi:MAG: S41 family peptidase [Ruminococcaceae bacterium]|nr:S41 family peptidase [Oscillospiraceae bacterium]